MIDGKLINAMAVLIAMSLSALPDGEAIMVLSVAKKMVKEGDPIDSAATQS